MNAYEKELNERLVRIYHSMEKLEEKMLSASQIIPLSFAEVNTLEAVAAGGKNGAATISEISEYLDIRLPSATAAVNRLERKGFVNREKCPDDGRVVRVKLTRAGRRVESVHRFFHRNMVRAAVKGLTEEERVAMLKGITKLDEYLGENIEEYTGMP